MKYRTFNVIKKGISLILIFAMLLSQSVIMTSFADETVTGRQDGTLLRWWYGRESESNDRWIYATVAEIYVNGEGINTLAYCIQNMKRGPQGDTYNRYNPWAVTYYADAAEGFRAILEYGYPNVKRPFGTQSDEEAYFATTQAFRFWVGENGSKYSYYWSQLGRFTNNQLRQYARQGEIPNVVKSLNSQGDRAMIAAIELLIKAREGAGTMPEYGVSNENISAQITDTNQNGVIDNGDWFITSVDIDGGNLSSWQIDTTKLPIGTVITDSAGNQWTIETGAAPPTSSGDTRLTIRIPYITPGEGAHTDNMIYSFNLVAFANGTINPKNVVLLAAADDNTDVSVQRLVYLDNKEHMVGAKTVTVTTGGVIPDEGHLTVVKEDAATGARIVGAGFALWHESNSGPGVAPLSPGVVRTNENGEATWNYLPPGMYYLAEVIVPGGYDSTRPYYEKVIVNSNSTTVVTAVNYPDNADSPKGNITVQKRDSQTGSTPRGSASLAGGIFDVFAAENIYYTENGQQKTISANTLVDTIYTYDSTGTSIPLPYGNYYVNEVMAPKGYLLNYNNISVTLNSADAAVTVTDNVIQNSISIHKTKGTTESSVPEPGITFNITRVDRGGDENDNLIITGRYETTSLTTDSNGNASTGMLPYGVYYVEQQNSTSGYSMVEPFFVELTSDTASYSYNLLDKEEKTPDYGAKIQITKKGSDTGDVIRNNSACFTIKDETGNLLVNANGTTNWCTGSDGTVTTSVVGRGTWTVSEVSAPDGYLLSSEKKSVTVNDSHIIETEPAVLSVEYVNGPVPPVLGQISITKTGEVIGANSDVSDFTYYDEAGNPKTVSVTTPGLSYENLAGAQIVVKTLQNITWNGNNYGAGDTIADFTSTTSAKVLSNLPLGKYTVQEIKAPTGYIIDSSVIEVELAKGEEQADVDLVSVSIRNNRPSTEILVNKRIEGLDITVPNDYFVFGVYSRGGAVPADTLVGILTNNTNTLKIPEGSYYVKEIGMTQDAVTAKYPEYSMSFNTGVLKEFTLDFAGQVNGKVTVDPIECVNTLSIFEVEISKLENGTNTKLGNAVLSIKDASGTEVFSGETKAGESLKVSLKPGTYTLQEMKAPAGYILNSTPVSFTVENNGNVSGTLSIENSPIIVSLRKTDEAGNGLPLAKFKIYTSTGNFVLETGETDANGYVSVSKLPAGDYYFMESQAPAGFTLSAQRYNFSVKTDGSTDGTLTMIDYKTSLVLKKVDDKDAPLPNAAFAVFDENNKIVATGESDVNGEVRFDSLPVGTYTVKETKAPDGYAIDTAPVTITINADGSVTGNTKFVNKPIDGVLVKTDLMDGSAVAGAMVKIWKDGEAEPEAANYVTDISGLISLKNLSPGTYRYKEVSAPEGYMLLDKEYTFTVGTDGTFSGTLAFTNAPTEMVIHKRDLTNGSPVPGAKIVIYDEAGEEYFSGSTGDDGDITLRYIPVGKYTFRETVAPDGYILNDTVYAFEVHEDGSVTGEDTISNERTSVKIVKMGETSNRLEGVKFELSDTSGKLGEYVTNDEGEIELSGLLIGHRYVLTEIKTVNGYALPDVPTSFELDENGNIVGINSKILALTNRLNKVVLEKVNDENVYLADAEFQILGENYDEVHKSDINGKIELVGLVPGTYRVKETKAPDGYLLNPNTYEFTVDEYGNVSGTTRIVNSKFEIEYSYNVTLTKISTDGEKLPEAGFNISGPDYNENVVSDKDGKIELTGLKPGTYTVKETKAPDGYILSEEVSTFTISEAGILTGKTVFENKKIEVIPPQPGLFDVTILKNDEQQRPLPGAEFHVWSTELGFDNSFVSNSEGKINIRGLKPGTYKLKETKAPRGYILDTETYEFSVSGEGVVTGVVSIVNRKMSQPDIPLTPVPTPPQTYSVTINKSNEEGKVMEGVLFTFYKNGNKLYTLPTNARGQIELTGLEPGIYTYEEIETLPGYILPTNRFQFVIGSDGVLSGDVNITNYREAKASVTLSKRDYDTGVYLEGCGIAVMDELGNTIRTVITQSNGRVVVEGLEPGTYKFREVKAPAGYAIDPNIYSFKIDKNGNVTGVTELRDKKVQVVVYKVDGEEQPLAGATFGLFAEKGGSPLYTTSSRVDGLAVFEGVVPGTYILKEIAAPVGYEMEDTAYTITVTETWENTSETYNFVNYEEEIVEDPDIPQADIPVFDTPKTSDDSPVLKLSLMIGASCLGIVLLLVLIAKEEKRERRK